VEITKPQLYAIACERIVKKNGKVIVIPEIVHLHAHNRANAIWTFNQDPIHRKHYRIVDAAIVVGYHVEDEHGDVMKA